MRKGPPSQWTLLAAALWCLSGACAEKATAVTIAEGMQHLRSGDVREWSEFPAKADAAQLEVRFDGSKNDGEFALRLRQQDVKQTWQVTVNGRKLGELVRDENDMVVWFAVPPGALVDGDNVLRIASMKRPGAASDDIRVGEVHLLDRPRSEALAEATVEVVVKDADSGQPVPCRLTIVDEAGALATTSASSNDHLAVRPGIIYTSQGKARFGVPLGKYTVYAGRGFEYSLAKGEVSAGPGSTSQLSLTIRREVPTEGYVACDPHIHTLSFSGHGDATILERMITLAGEGIELPVAADHNVHIDYEPHAVSAGVRQYFTPVMGNEVTTPVGHFIAFPVQAGVRVPSSRLREWPAIFSEIFGTPGVKVAILNHARDLHSGVRPFGPKLFNAVVAERHDGEALQCTAMEVINSGATQSDHLRLMHDWMAVLNRGYVVTPVGSSDSHDVARHFVGQGRTYVRVSDKDVSNIDVPAAIDSFLQGRVRVSYGLMAELKVNGRYDSGDLARLSGDQVNLEVRVLGPHWVRAQSVQLYANGQLVREESIPSREGAAGGVQYQAAWSLPRPKHDVHLVAVALGEGIEAPYWRTAKPYQPTSLDWQSKTLGCSGTVRLDADGDGRWSSARDYAERLLAESKGDLARLLASLSEYDEPTAAHSAHLVRLAGEPLLSGEVSEKLRQADETVQRGFRRYIAAWREGEEASLAP